MASPRMTVPEFWAGVRMGSPEECWPWTRRTDLKGYGRVGSQSISSTRLAHRVAWELSMGPIPPRLFVCHRCDNPPCCNPAHLFPATAAENNADMAAKGRAYNGGGLRGEAHGMAKLTNNDVLAIRASGEQQRTLARQYGVSQSTIWRAIHGKTRFLQ